MIILGSFKGKRDLTIKGANLKNLITLIKRHNYLNIDRIKFLSSFENINQEKPLLKTTYDNLKIISGQGRLNYKRQT